MSTRSEQTRILEQRGGVILERDTRFCTVRLRIPGGIISPGQLRGIADITRNLGIGTVHLTTRQTMEVPHIPLEKVSSMLIALEKDGIRLDSEHEGVVNITACPGTDRCRFSNIETSSILRRLDIVHSGREMPVRVRIAISACPNGCTSERLSDIGITGLRTPIGNEELCSGCGACAKICKEKAISMLNGHLAIDSERCAECGMCILSCPFQSIQGTAPRYLITVGGRRGRHPVAGRELIRVDSEDKAAGVIHRVLDWIQECAYPEINLADQLDRMDFSAFQLQLIQEFDKSEP